MNGIKRPAPEESEQHLCLDKAYSGEPCTSVAEDNGYTVHVPDKVNAKKNEGANQDDLSPGADYLTERVNCYCSPNTA